MCALSLLAGALTFPEALKLLLDKITLALGRVISLKTLRSPHQNLRLPKGQTENYC